MLPKLDEIRMATIIVDNVGFDVLVNNVNVHATTFNINVVNALNRTGTVHIG